MDRENTERSLPGVAVVVPTHGRPRQLERCLAALARQDYPAHLLRAVIVEDGGPTAQLEALRTRPFGGIQVVWEAQPHSGPAKARNHGARVAAMPVLAFTDDDCLPRPDWVRNLVGRLELNPRRIVGGHTVNACRGNLFSAASQWLVNHLTGDGLGRREPFFASNNFALAREAFLALEGFDSAFPVAGGEDRDFCDRCATEGMEFLHEPRAVIDHEHRLGPLSFLRQHYRYGRGAYLFQRARTGRTGEPFSRRIDLRHYLDMLRGPLREGIGPRSLSISMLVALSQFPNALGFFVERGRRGKA